MSTPQAGTFRLLASWLYVLLLTVPQVKGSLIKYLSLSGVLLMLKLSSQHLVSGKVLWCGTEMRRRAEEFVWGRCCVLMRMRVWISLRSAPAEFGCVRAGGWMFVGPMTDCVDQTRIRMFVEPVPVPNSESFPGDWQTDGQTRVLFSARQTNRTLLSSILLR